MELARTTADSTIGLAQSKLGTSRKTPGCPWTKIPGMDDCAEFQSWLLWGANAAGNGPISWVDNFKTAPNGTYHAGKTGLRRGDVVLFDWDGNGVGNHVEMCFSNPDLAGTFMTIGANGSDTINVGYRFRNAYVLGYFRPAYGVHLATASSGATTVPTTPKEPEMAQSDINNARASVWMATFPEKAAKNRAAIQKAYLSELGRPADDGGLEGFMVSMALGNSITWVVLKIRASVEYAKRQKQLAAKKAKK